MPIIKPNMSLDIRQLYDAYNKQFKKWAEWHFPKYDSYTHEDVFHEALIIYLENSKKGKFQNLNVPLINLLIGIGHKLFLKKWTSKQLLTFPEQIPESEKENLTNVLDTIIAEETETEKAAWLKDGFDKLGEECQELLTLFYYEQKKIPEIVELLGYKNENVASASKSRCLKTLKDILGNHDKPE